jgi:hypothetical protein
MHCISQLKQKNSERFVGIKHLLLIIFLRLRTVCTTLGVFISWRLKDAAAVREVNRFELGNTVLIYMIMYLMYHFPALPSAAITRSSIQTEKTERAASITVLLM